MYANEYQGFQKREDPKWEESGCVYHEERAEVKVMVAYHGICVAGFTDMDELKRYRVE